MRDAREDQFIGRAAMLYLAALLTVMAWLMLAPHFYPFGGYVDLPFGHTIGVDFTPDPGVFFDVW